MTLLSKRTDRELQAERVFGVTPEVAKGLVDIHAVHPEYIVRLWRAQR